jgi:hypothetical protein
VEREEVALMQVTINRPIIDRVSAGHQHYRQPRGCRRSRAGHLLGRDRKIDTFRGQAALASWIYRIAANAAYHKRMSSARRRHEISLGEILPSFHEDGCYITSVSGQEQR